MDRVAKVEEYLKDGMASEVDPSSTSDSGFAPDIPHSRAYLKGNDEAEKNEDFMAAIKSDNKMRAETLWYHHSDVYLKYIHSFIRSTMEQETDTMLIFLLKALDSSLSSTYVNLGSPNLDERERQRLFYVACDHGFNSLFRKVNVNHSTEVRIKGLTKAVRKNQFHIAEMLVKNSKDIESNELLSVVMQSYAATTTPGIMKMAIKARISSCSVAKQWEVLEFVCVKGLATCIPLMKELPKNLEFVKRGLKNTRDSQLVGEILSSVTGHDVIKVAASYEYHTRLRQNRSNVYLAVSQHSTRPFRIHPSSVQTCTMDLIVNKKLVYLSRCTALFSTAQHLNKYKHSKSFLDNAFNAFLPCDRCLKSVDPDGHITWRHILQIRKYYKATKDFSFLYEDCIKDDNIILMHAILEEAKFEIPTPFVIRDTLKMCAEMWAGDDMTEFVVSWITRSFVTKYKKYFEFLEAYVALNYHDLHIVSIYHGRNSPNCTHFLHVPIVWKPLTSVRSKPAEEKPEKKRYIEVTTQTAESLFRAHTNLNIITTSWYKLRNGKLLKSPCIVLYCWAKGYVPILESNFPTVIEGIPTDVREGYCLFGNNPLSVGEHIQTIQSKHGTLGGFVEKNNEILGLTCSHVLYPMQDLQLSEQEERSVCTLDRTIIGKTVAHVFKHGNANDASVDAALFRVSEEFDVNGAFPNIPLEDLRRLGLDPGHQPKYWNGASLDIFRKTKLRNPVIKYGAETRLTKGSLAADGCHVRIYSMSLLMQEIIFNLIETDTDQASETSDVEMREIDQAQCVDTRSFIMYGQTEIEGHAYSAPFFSPGDSGALVFYIEDVEGRDEMKCIGLAIGRTSHGTCIMTPIKNVLKDLDAILDPQKTGTPLKLKSFSRPQQSSSEFTCAQTPSSGGDKAMNESSQKQGTTTQGHIDMTPFVAMMQNFGEQFSASIGRTLDQKLAPLQNDNIIFHAQFGSLQKKIETVENRLGSVESKLMNMDRKPNTSNDDNDVQDQN